MGPRDERYQGPEVRRIAEEWQVQLLKRNRVLGAGVGVTGHETIKVDSSPVLWVLETTGETGLHLGAVGALAGFQQGSGPMGFAFRKPRPAVGPGLGSTAEPARAGGVEWAGLGDFLDVREPGSPCFGFERLCGSWEEGLSRRGRGHIAGMLSGDPDGHWCGKDSAHPGSSRPGVDLYFFMFFFRV